MEYRSTLLLLWRKYNRFLFSGVPLLFSHPAIPERIPIDAILHERNHGTGWENAFSGVA